MNTTPDKSRVLTEDPKESIGSCLAFQCRDMSCDHRDAWVYGIVHGWDHCLKEVAKKHGWTPEAVARLKRLRKRWLELK